MRTLLIFIFLSLALCSKNSEMVSRINNMKTTWTAQEYSKDYTPNLGAFLDHPNVLPRKTFKTYNDDLPESFDLREKFPDCKSIGTIRDQANCGSCWAFGASEVMSDRICIEKKEQVMISPSDLASCCFNCGFGCNGGWPEQAFVYWKQFGVVTGGDKGDNRTCLPYFLDKCDHHVKGKYGPCPPVVDEPECVEQCQEGYDKAWKDDKHFAKDAYTVSGEQEMMQEIYEHGSIEGSFTVYEDFTFYKSGVYQHVEGKVAGGHAIKILGWGVENGNKYWLCANSWNEGWGDNGFFKILKGKNECGIENTAAAGIPA